MKSPSAPAVIGPGAAAVIAGLVTVPQAAGLEDIVACAIYASALRLPIDQLLGPTILGQAVRLHPAMIIFSFLSGGFLFGAVGAILAVPVTLLIKVMPTIFYDE